MGSPAELSVELFLGEVLLAHPFQSGTDEFAIRLEESVRNSGRLGFKPALAVLNHARVRHRVFLRKGVGNSPAIHDGFSIELEQGNAQFRVPRAESHAVAAFGLRLSLE
jgi:hypothetical protein